MKRMKIALVAHDARKKELKEWCTHNAEVLSQHKLYATGTTAKLLSTIEYEDKDFNKVEKLAVVPLLSGPLGGDQQVGSMIAEGNLDMLIFFCDNLITQGHQQDVGALSRLASLYNIAFATNRTTADMLITSPLFTDSSYERKIPGAISDYANRSLK